MKGIAESIGWRTWLYISGFLLAVFAMGLNTNLFLGCTLMLFSIVKFPSIL